MIGKGTLVRYKGNDKRLWQGKLMSVHERNGDKLTVWHEQKQNGKWSTITMTIKDVEEVC